MRNRSLILLLTNLCADLVDARLRMEREVVLQPALDAGGDQVVIVRDASAIAHYVVQGHRRRIRPVLVKAGQQGGLVAAIGPEMELSASGLEE
ncbi:hypothetical protein Aduo_001768 [Ancylostoma duodenale]